MISSAWSIVSARALSKTLHKWCRVPPSHFWQSTDYCTIWRPFVTASVAWVVIKVACQFLPSRFGHRVTEYDLSVARRHLVTASPTQGLIKVAYEISAHIMGALYGPLYYLSAAISFIAPEWLRTNLVQTKRWTPCWCCSLALFFFFFFFDVLIILNK